jgi:hypothetical protein
MGAVRPLAGNPPDQLPKTHLRVAYLSDAETIGVKSDVDLSRRGLSPASGVDGPTSITNVTRQAITKHPRVMEQAGLVRGTRHGRESVGNWTSSALKTRAPTSI